MFLHQISGVKHATSHLLQSRPAHNALKVFLAWRTDSHFHIVQEAMGLSEYHADKVTTPGSLKYTQDMSSYLTAVSGCQIAPGAHSQGPYEALYLQMYMTDKSLTYCQDQGHYGKFITCDRILKGKSTAYIKSLYKLYRNAITASHSLARLEVRVPLAKAAEVLLYSIDEGLLQDSLVSFPPEEWW